MLDDMLEKSNLERQSLEQRLNEALKGIEDSKNDHKDYTKTLVKKLSDQLQQL